MTGESVRTIRFYESFGLLAEPHRTGGRYRDYDLEAVEELRAIRTLHAAGLALSEIADIVTLSRRPHPCPELLLGLVATTQSKIDARLAACQRVRDELQDLQSSSRSDNS